MRIIDTGVVKLMVPTGEDIESIEVGKKAPDCFGNMSDVKRIFYRTVNRNGKKCVGYYTDFGPYASISMSLTEGELVRTVAACNIYKSAELDRFEKMAS